MNAYPRQQVIAFANVPERRFFYITFAGVACFAYSLARPDPNDRHIPFLVLESAEEIERHPVPFLTVGSDEFDGSVIVFLDEPEVIGAGGANGLDHVGNQDRSSQLLCVGEDLWIRAATPADRAGARISVSILSGQTFTRDVDMASPVPEWRLVFRNKAGERVWEKLFGA